MPHSSASFVHAHTCACTLQPCTGFPAALLSSKPCHYVCTSDFLQLTYPLDTLRLRLAVDPSVVGMRGAARILMAEGSGLAFYRGIGVAMLGRQSRALLIVQMDECTWASADCCKPQA